MSSFLACVALAMATPSFGTQFIKSTDSLRERLSIHINGFSYHFASDREDLNELNYGLGLSYHLGQIRSESWFLNDFRIAVEADAYSDSFSELGYRFGASFQRRLWRSLDWGFGVGLIHEDNLKEKSGLYLYPYLLPYLQTNFDHPVNARFIFVAPVHNEGIIALQFIADF